MSVLKVLIAEDEPVSRKLLNAALTQWGYDVVSTSDGEAARARLLEGGIDLCLLDWEMPRMTGLDVCKWVRSSGLTPAPNVILLTAKDDPKDIAAGYGAGADDYVTKPFNAGELRSRVSTFAKRKQQAEAEQIRAAHADPFELYRAGFNPAQLNSRGK
jgi:DNA-binding response OmpR family regulator